MRFRLEQGDDAVARLIAQVEAFLSEHDVPIKTIYAMNVCVEELLVNIVQHGYGGGGAVDVDVDVMLSNDEALVIEISDGAVAFDPITDAPPPDLEAALDDRPIGGLGIHMIKKMTDDLSYRREDGRNHVRMVKRLDA